jgi:hypothetical protein
VRAERGGGVKHVVNFSGGLCSFWAAHRVAQKHGTKNMVLLFADTLEEDEDLYAFNAQSSELLGVPITRVSRELGVWDLFMRQGMIGNSRFPICSVYLKREPLDEWHEKNCLNIRDEEQGQLIPDGREPATIYMGFDWSEQNRLNDIRAEKPLWRIEAPMIDEPIWDKCRMEKEARAIGLTIPRAYELGFPHNNCGMRCVRAGISHWVHLFKVFPERFLDWEEKEQIAIQHLQHRSIEWLSILKDRRGGVTKSMTLRQLRERIEGGENLPKHEWGGCGCGGAIKFQEAA